MSPPNLRAGVSRFRPRRVRVAVIANANVGREFGFDQGFELYDTSMYKLGVSQVQPMLDWIGAEPERPFFLFVNLMTPHLPYRPPAPWQERFLAGADILMREAGRTV